MYKQINKLIKVALVSVLLLASVTAECKGGYSSGGGRGGFSSGYSGRSSFSSPSRSSFSAPSRPMALSQPARAPMRSSTTTTRSVSSRSYSSHVNYGGGHMYGGFGMGYGYSNGILTGMILGNMMHPYGTMMYAGPGMYANNALLYPDGRVVNQQGYLVGNYANGQFAATTDGGMVAQQVPSDAIQQAPVQQVATPIVIQDNSAQTLICVIVAGLLVFFLILGLVL